MFNEKLRVNRFTPLFKNGNINMYKHKGEELKNE